MASYRKRDGSWEYRISYKTPDGKYKQKSKRGFRTKKEAELAAAEAERLLNSTTIFDENISLYDYFDKWAKIYKKPHVSIGTWKNYDQTLKLIEREFGQTKIRAITPSIYQQFLNNLGKRYYQATIHKVHHRIRRAVKQAVVEKLIDTNFTDLAKINAERQHKPIEDKFLEENEYLSLLTTLKQNCPQTDYVQLYLLSVTGMRIGESLGLTWNDIDFKNGLININKTWNVYTNAEFAPTKNKQSMRTIPLDNTTAKILLQFKTEEWTKNPYNRLFIRVNHPWLNRLIKKLTKTNIHVHSLRHTYASYLISRQIDLLTISNLLGHKDLTVTLQTYAHQLEQQKEKDFKEIKKLFG